MCEKRLVYVCNAGWYFRLHWLARARYFIGEGWSVHLICPMESAEQKQELSKDGLFVHDFRIDRKSIGLVGALKEFMRLYSMIKKLSPDLINAITIKPNVYVGIISVLEGIPAALSVTGLGIIFSSNTIKSKIARVFTLPLYWLIAKFSQRLFFIFENSNDRAVLIERANIPAGKCAVVSGAGVDPSLYRAVPITKVDSTLKLLYASRLLKSKGLLDLIAAVNRLQEKGYSVELTIAGIVDTNSDDAISLSEIDAMTSPSHIRYLGERDDVPKLVAETHIVCLPTYYGKRQTNHTLPSL
ncbi:glycosyltransferase [Teredinibacter turnerae]|uniref:glycosyltransferase n=1 Tax=Teredinibacter turnerae TaxID=2426 RepID=UPI00039993E4|nr:glycosyltransferase [Teredinibacter turnerae]